MHNLREKAEVLIMRIEVSGFEENAEKLITWYCIEITKQVLVKLRRFIIVR